MELTDKETKIYNEIVTRIEEDDDLYEATKAALYYVYGWLDALLHTNQITAAEAYAILKEIKNKLNMNESKSNLWDIFQKLEELRELADQTWARCDLKVIDELLELIRFYYQFAE